MYKVNLVLLLLLPLFTKAQQRFSTQVFAGYAATQVQGDGLGLDYGLTKKWALGFELAYLQKGSRKNANPEKNDLTFYKMALHYAEIPILLKFKQKKLTIAAGPSIGYLLKATEENAFEKQVSTATFSKIDLQLSIGASYAITQKLQLSSRIANSITAIRKVENGINYTLDRKSVV